MPTYTPETEAVRLRELGFDPSSHRINPDGKIVRLRGRLPQPTVESPQAPIAPTQASTEPPWWESLLRGAGESAGPTAAALAVGKVGAGLGAPLGPVGSIGGGLGGALLGGGLAAYAQSKIVPQDIKEKIFLRPEDLQANPAMSLTGQFVPSTLAFNPAKGVAQLPRAVRAVSRGLRGGALETAEKTLLTNIGVNVGAEAGQELVEQQLEGREFSPGRLALRTGLATILNEPTRLGRAMGFAPTPPEGTKMVVRGGEDVNLRGKRPPHPDVDFNYPEMIKTPEGVTKTVPEGKVTPIDLSERASRLIRRARKSRQRGQVEVIGEIPAEGRESIEFEYSDLIKKRTVEKLKELPEGRRVAGLIEGPVETRFTSKPGKPVYEQPAPKEVKRLPEESLSTKQDRELYKRVSEEARREVDEALMREAPTEAERIQEMYEAKSAKERIEKTRKYARKFQEESTKISDEALKSLPPEVAAKVDGLSLAQAKERGFNIELVDTIVNDKGQQMAGEFIGDKNLIRLAEKAGTDTLFHETAHGMIRDFAQSKSKADTKLLERLQKVFGDDWEEAVATAAGERGVERAVANVSGKLRPKAKVVLNDILVNFKTKLGLASKKDLINHFAARQELDAPYGTRAELLPDDVIAKAGGVTTPTEEVPAAEPAKPGEVKNQAEPSYASKFQGDPLIKQDVKTIETSPPEVKKNILATSVKNAYMKVFGSTTDKMRRSGDPSKTYGAEKAETAKIVEDGYYGKFFTPFQEQLYNPILNRQGITKKEMARIDQHNAELATNGETKIKLTQREEAARKAFQDQMEWIADQNTVRKIDKKLNYWPAMTSKEVIYEWQQRPTSDKSKKFEKMMLDHAMKKGVSLEDAKADLLEYRRAISNVNSGNDSLDFGPFHKRAGIGMPVELQDNNLVSRLMRYSRRAAKDLANHEFFTKDERMRYIFGISKPKEGFPIPEKAPLLDDGTPVEFRGDDQQVQALQRWRTGNFRTLEQPVLFAMTRLFNSALLGPGTAARNMAQAPMNFATIVGARNASAMAQGMTHLLASYKRALSYGATKMKLGDLDIGAAVHPSKWADRFNHLADIMRKYSGRELSEQLERAFFFAGGEHVALAEIGRAMRGNKKSIKFLEDYGKSAKKEIAELLSGNKTITDVKDDTIYKIAKEITDAAAGSYDERGLPAGVMEGAFAPFLALSRWSIERSNRVYKAAIDPLLTKGDPLPLLYHTLGALLTGKAIQEMNKVLTNQLPFEPTPEEAFSTENKEQQARSIASLMQLSAFVGLAGDFMKATSDVATGHNPRLPISFPMWDFLSETMVENVSMAAAAKQEGVDNFTIMEAFITEVLKNSIQGFRMYHNNFIGKEDQERKAKYRDIRIFKELEGNPPVSIPVSANRYARPDEREFKRTKDLNKAMELAPKVIEQRFKEADGDFEKLSSGLKGARTTSYQTIPDPATRPREFIQYMQFLTKTQGEEAASERFQDWYLQKQVNSIKKGLIPTL